MIASGIDDAFDAAVVAAVALPAVTTALLAAAWWLGLRSRERVVAVAVTWAFLLVTAGTLGATIARWCGHACERIDLGAWFTVGHYTFRWTLCADDLSLPFAAFAALLTGSIAAFSRRYLHRERGFFRFYFLLALFGLGVQIVVLAGGLDLLFFGWELVGLTSALLIAFFHERQKPVEHGLRAFVTYRVCDVGLLAATVLMHHALGSAAFVAHGGEPFAALAVPAHTTTAIAFLLVWASIGESAQVPLGGWLPRAMEGPTPSSAIFYGAISIHLGPYLLLRAAPLLDAAPAARWTVVAIGVATALHATFVGRVQTDIKSVLAYASMTQVGLIVAEIGFGLRVLPLVHIVGHATVRSLEILRSPSLLQDHRHLEQAIGRTVPRAPLHFERLLPTRLRPWFYRHALERGSFDAVLRDRIVVPLLRGIRRLDALDRRLTGLWAGLHDDQPRKGPR
jgi:NADH-quinone oxidoreductase subunit L